MPSSDVAAESVDELPSGLICIGTYESCAAGSERGLVALAMGFPYWLVPSDAGFALLVEAGAEEMVREQLRRFERESIGWPPAPVMRTSAIRQVDIAVALLWALTVFAVFWAQQVNPGLSALGALEPAAILDRHEAWRLGTALFLHADLGHVISNVVSGVFIFSATTAVFGLARGWALILASALLGNLLSVFGPGAGEYFSVGASTAIFGALGLLTGRALEVARGVRTRRAPMMFGPAAAGLTILALYGAGGQNVDVGAHVCGFAAGVVCGFIGAGAREESRG